MKQKLNAVDSFETLVANADNQVVCEYITDLLYSGGTNLNPPTSEEIDMELNRFIESVYEIAFGDGAINKDYSRKEVLEKLQEYSATSLQLLNERRDYV